MTERPPNPAAAPPPVLRVTTYDQVSSWLMAVIVALLGSVALLSIAWLASRTSPPAAAIPVEFVEIAGGVEDGTIDESLLVESPEAEAPDATPAEVIAEERESRESLDSVMELAEDAAEQTDKQPEPGFQSSGKTAKATGTGRRALGSGPGTAGYPREQRWLIRFADRQSLDEYAKQLDFFGIEFGAIVAGRLSYVSKFAAPRPSVRSVAGGGGETRLYMTWQGGGRKEADLQLFRKAGVEVGQGVIFQFYPKPAEDTLARLEFEYKKRRAEEIRRTYFEVTPKDGGYVFQVIRQTYLK